MIAQAKGKIQADADAAAESKRIEEINKSWKVDGTQHIDGLRYFPDGTVVGGVNLY